jgi:hypothetical protein
MQPGEAQEVRRSAAEHGRRRAAKIPVFMTSPFR